MCPACLSTLALIAAGTGSTAGLGAVVVKKLRGQRDVKDPEPKTRGPAPDQKEEAR